MAMKTAALEPLRHSIKEPIPAIFQAWELLSSAAEVHLNSNHVAAEVLFHQANLSEVWNWTNPAWGRPDLNVRVPKPDDDTQDGPKAERDPLRDIRRPPKAHKE